MKFIRFFISSLNLNCRIVENPNAELKDLVIDLDYKFFKHNKYSKKFQIVLKLNLNPEENEPGYIINLEAIGEFEFPESIKEENHDKLLFNTCVPLMLGNIRGTLMMITSPLVFGKYMLPSLSMQDIIEAGKPDGSQPLEG